MKKVFVLACLSIFVLASCKKDRTCVCTATLFGSSATESIIIKDAKKKDAEATCAKNNVAGIVSCELN